MIHLLQERGARNCEEGYGGDIRIRHVVILGHGNDRRVLVVGMTIEWGADDGVTREWGGG